MMSSATYLENVPGKSNTIPERLKKCSASTRNRVQLNPERRSESARNPVQLHRGIPFTFVRIPHHYRAVKDSGGKTSTQISALPIPSPQAVKTASPVTILF
jgi:hypothetical protein